MSPTTLALTILGVTATSTGIGIAVVNLTNTNNESIDEKIENLWKEIKENVNYLNTRITEIMKETSLKERYPQTLAKVTTIATTTTTNNTYNLNPYVNPQEMYEKLQNINQELKKILELLEKSKK